MGVLWKKYGHLAWGKSQGCKIRYAAFPKSCILGLVVGHGLLAHRGQWSPEDGFASAEDKLDVAIAAMGFEEGALNGFCCVFLDESENPVSIDFIAARRLRTVELM
jgi:hypothetical protein